MSSCLLDLFPVECLYMIFEYFWAQEILYSFRNVTKYINQVLDKYNGYLVNFKSIRKQHFELICRFIKPYQIASLTISDRNDTIGQSQLFLSFFSIDQLKNLRALTLIDINRDSISVLSDLHKLPHLVSIEIDSYSRLSLDLIASQLKRLIVNSCPDDYSNHGLLIPLIQLPHLRYLSLERCSFARLYSILRLASNLISLRISIICWSSTEMNLLINNDKELPFRLVHLYMRMNVHISQDSIQQFLLRMPCLRHIELAISRGAAKSLCDGYQWEVFIENQLTMLTRFDFEFIFAWSEIHDDEEKSIIAPFRTSFWTGKERQWFVAYNHPYRTLFTVPRFAPTTCSHPCELIVPHNTTVPVDQQAIFLDHITTLDIDYSETSSYRYQNIQKLTLSFPNFDQQLLDLSKVEVLTLQGKEWTLEVLVQLIYRSMPMLSHLTIPIQFSWEISHHSNVMSLVNIHTLNLSEYSGFSNDEKFYWTQFFPCVQRLIIKINTLRQMALLIDRFEHLSCGSFLVVNCQISTMEQRHEPPVTREWLIDNTRRLSINNNFTCGIDYEYRSWSHLWIGDPEIRLKKTKGTNRLCQCFPRCSLK